ncbi:MAG: autotransporter outer membrane beta-barrel domain-containing protein [Gammaproteobacteria bacterium]|nr:autotransporter outer membrane beta-barrel domain-containing protein [Gammaproteobacteria bacterium]
MTTLSRYSLQAILGILLLNISSAALAFTIIEIPDSDSSPGSSITDAISFQSQVQPVIGAIQAHILDSRHRKKSAKSAQQGNVLASNSHAQTMSDADFIKVSFDGVDSDNALKSLWVSSSMTSFDNDFSRTKYDGDMQMLLAGLDYTLSDKYIFGVAFSFEASDIDTTFNAGNQQIEGFSINPYFAYLISDTWSVDLSIGLGEFDTDQFRTIGILDVGPPPGITTSSITSDFSSTREFLTSNLTYSTNRGNWYLTGWLGFLVANMDQDGYEESDSTVIDGQDLDIERWNLGGEAAYSHRSSESYFGLVYEKETDVNEVEFATGEQPENDDDSMLVTVGWRYYGSEIVVNFEFNSRLGADDVSENSISSTLRIDL